MIISSVDCLRSFEWNIQSTISIIQDFEWNSGEGPLYWWRLDFLPKLCPPTSCTPGISDCTFTGPLDDPCCDVSCCISRTREVMHVLATSVDHVCERLNESCNWKPTGYIKKIQRFNRPALCCDVDKMIADGQTIEDTYTEYDFISNCNCASWIDPCDNQVTYPCQSDTVPMSFASFRSLKELKNLPDELTLRHNLDIGIPKEALLKYNKDSNKWIDNFHIEDKLFRWNVVFDCSAEGYEDFSWKVGTYISKIKKANGTRLNSRVIAFLKADALSFAMKSGKSLVNSSVIDDIGIFKKLDFKVSVKV